ncbi:MAG: type I glyceraldehyde-3-phosphate dehydrogenase [Actinobacteria bacterium]|nr:type I glyceraldehyde-3-phosphate dehydrogenase [Actinomycetota bacterium]
MTVRTAINGFGRIGRNFCRAAWERGVDLEVVAVNDLTSPAVNAHLLAYDSTQGHFAADIRVEKDELVVDKRRIAVLAERDPASLPWKELGVDLVVECTGLFTTREGAAKHIEAGAERVVISAPATGVDATFVIGVNDDTFDPSKHQVVSNASCTTNCFVPMVKVLDDAFGIKQGLMTTVHAYTNDQNLLDLAHRDLRRARAAAVNIVPSSTGAARATGLVLEAMQGRLDGTSLRVPVQDGSITDLTAILDQEVQVKDVNEAFRAASQVGPLARVLDYSEQPLVSSDIVGSPASCTFDAGLTMALAANEGKTLVKVMGWYDNEWGYANRLVDLALLVGGSVKASSGTAGKGDLR